MKTGSIMKTKIRIRGKHVLIAVLIAILLVNGLWWINRALYNKYVTDDYPAPYNNSLYGKNISGINYNVAKPMYPSFHGNFAIGNNDDSIALLIWPGFFFVGDYEYGLQIYDHDIEHGYMLYVDENLNYLDTEKNKYGVDEKEIILEILQKNAQELQEILNLAKEEWGLN